MEKFNMTSSEEAGSSTSNEEFEGIMDWMKAGMTLMGLVGNSLAYNTANYLPVSNLSVLMKYLAVWDSLAAVNISLLSSSAIFTIDIINRNVSFLIRAGYPKKSLTHRSKFCFDFLARF